MAARCRFPSRRRRRPERADSTWSNGRLGRRREAFESLLGQIPADFALPIAIVQHRSARYPNLMARVLSRHTELPVKIAEAGERPRPGVVYLAPPDAHLMVDADLRVALANGRKIRRVLFSTAPTACRR